MDGMALIEVLEALFIFGEDVLDAKVAFARFVGSFGGFEVWFYWLLSGGLLPIKGVVGVL